MASFSRYLLLFLLLNSILLINHTINCEDDDDDNVPDVPDNDHEDEENRLIQGINGHRATLRLSPLTENDVAECLAEEIADQYKNQPCPGSNTVPGTRPQLSNYSSLLAKCGANATATRDGVVLPTCVPNRVPNLVLSSYTNSSQFSQYINDGKFSVIGVGTEDNWTVVVLTTNIPGSGGSRRGPPSDDDEDDEEDILLQGINTFRASLNLSALTENNKAECLADEIADQFNNRPCPTTTRPSIIPVSNYTNVLAKCQVNVATTRDGVILPVCVPNLVPNLVLANYTNSSQYSQYLNDTKFTGIGIGTEDDWMVIVLTTNTPAGRFSASQGIGNANVAAKVDPIYHLLVTLTIGFLMILL